MLKKALSALLFLCLFPFYLCASKPPQLTPQETKHKIQEILKAHVCHHQLTPELFKRALINYIDELDPAKTYLLESEIVAWTNPSESSLQEALEAYHKDILYPFKDIYKIMLSAIERRSELEENLNNLPATPATQTINLKELPWATTPAQLQERLSHIRSLQLKAADKLDSKSTQMQFIQRLNKRRLSREKEIIGQNSKEQEQIILSFILKAVSSSLDSQTLYFTPTEANQFMIQVQQRLFGIGAQLRDDLDGFTVTKIVDGSPAAQAGTLKMGDKIIAVNQEMVVGMDIVEAVALVRGPQGSQVELTVLREVKEGDISKEEKLSFVLIRGEIVLQESRLETTFEPYADGIIATLHLHSFYQDNHTSSADDLAAAINKLKQEHTIKGIILDLRENGGGLLPQAVAVSGLFLSKGIVVSIKDNTQQVQHLRHLDNRKIWDGPLIVLTSRTSASAAEIVAQTLQDYGRALIVGDAETFGKGTFQTFTLESNHFGKVNPKGEYKVTRGRYYTVSGKSPQLVGVKADICVPGPFSQMEIGEKHSKFPVATDAIAAHFNDDLSDVPFMHRQHIESLYKKDKQLIMTTYAPLLGTLQKNSQHRLDENKHYQALLKESAKEPDNHDIFEFFQKTDLQLMEAKNIMKDLLYLMHSSRAA